MKGIESVNAIIPEGINDMRYYVTNRKNWKAKRMLETYIERWSIEVMHNDFKQDGLGGIPLGKLFRTELYIHPIISGGILLEIASIDP